jgi:hypothetical protein
MIETLILKANFHTLPIQNPSRGLGSRLLALWMTVAALMRRIDALSWGISTA